MYFIFLLYRFLFAMIPLLFKEKSAVQALLLISITVIYIAIILNFNCYIKKSDLYLEMICLGIFLIMQHHLLLFMDGGILNGTPNNVSLDSMLSFQQIIDITFPIFAILAAFIFIGYIFSGFTKRLLLKYQKYKAVKYILEILKTKPKDKVE